MKMNKQAGPTYKAKRIFLSYVNQTAGFILQFLNYVGSSRLLDCQLQLDYNRTDFLYIVFYNVQIPYTLKQVFQNDSKRSVISKTQCNISKQNKGLLTSKTSLQTC